jgi:Helix-turn-helix domain
MVSNRQELSMADLSKSIWLTRSEVADRFKLPPATLDQWACRGHGPKYALFGRHARYRLSDVIAWENEQFDDVRAPASPMGAA